MGDVKLSVVEGMEGGMFSCMPLPLDWTVQVDTLAGVIYAVRRFGDRHGPLAVLICASLLNRLTSGELSTVWERKVVRLLMT